MGNVNLLFAIRKYVPNAHLIKLQHKSMERLIDLEEGWMNITYKGKRKNFVSEKTW